MSFARNLQTDHGDSPAEKSLLLKMGSTEFKALWIGCYRSHFQLTDHHQGGSPEF